MPVASYAVREGKWIEGAASRDSRQYRTIQSRQAVSHASFVTCAAPLAVAGSRACRFFSRTCVFAAGDWRISGPRFAPLGDSGVPVDLV